MDEKETAKVEQLSQDDTMKQLLQTIADSQKKQTELLEILRAEKQEKQVNQTPEKDAGATEINLLEVFELFVKKWWLIAIAAIVCAAVVFCACYAVYVPTYTATVKLYINNASELGTVSTVKVTQSDLTTSQSLVKTYSTLLKTYKVLGAVGEHLTDYGYEEMTYETLSKMIESGSDSNTEVFYVTVTDTWPQRAIDIANEIADELPEQIADVIEGSSARIVDRAQVAKLKSSGLVKNSVIAAFVGIVLACAFIFVYDYLMSDTIEDESWFASTFDDIPYLGDVPDSKENSGHRYGKYGYRYGHDYGYYRKSESAENQEG